MDAAVQQRIFNLFGDLLDYPTPALAEQAQECAARLLPEQPVPANRLYDFMEWARRARNNDLGRLEEIYTGTFDVNPACYIFAGYMMFGESFDRGKFLVRLQQRYRERGFDWGRELADHVPVILRFLGTLNPDEELAQNLIDKCLVPVLRKMHGNFEPGTTNPYAGVLRALLDVLEPLTVDELESLPFVAPGHSNPQPFLPIRQ